MLVVATHWHDDHIRGMAKTVDVCTNADFCCSSVLRTEEFLSAAHALESRHVATFGSGLREIHSVFSGLRDAGATPTWAIVNRRILATDRCQVWSLAPTDDAFVDFLRQLADLLPKVGQAETRIRSLSPNDVAVVLWIAIGDVSVLLGSDLERRGWSTVVQDATRPAGRASVFKVPHHGSESAHEPEVWAQMLIQEPVAILSPWKRGGRVVPNQGDRQRILDKTANAYSSASSVSSTQVRRRSSVVERTIRQSGIKIRRMPTPDGVRLRRRMDSSDQWKVELFGSACHLEDFAS